MESSGKGSERDTSVKLTKSHKAQIKCLNIHCKHGDNLISATEAVCIYYRVDYKPRKQVCSQCFEDFKEYLEKLKKRHEKNPIRNNPINNNSSHNINKSSDDNSNSNKVMTKYKQSISNENLHCEPNSNLDPHLEFAIKDYFENNKTVVDIQKQICNDLARSRKMTTNEVNDIVFRINRDIKTTNNLLRNIYNPSVSHLNPEHISNNQIDSKIYIKDLHLSPVKTETNKEKCGTENNAIIFDKTSMEAPASIPADKQFVYPPVNQELEVYGMKFNSLEPWYKCKIQNLISNDYLFVKFDTEEMILNKTQLAYTTEHPIQFSVGTRVISKLSNKDITNYYVGIIGEPPNTLNKFRYLLFFDNGYVQYRSHKDIQLIIKTSEPVWPLVHPDSQEFIRNYLTEYPDCKMLNLACRQYVKVNCKSTWETAKVVEIDASLVKLYYPRSKHCEWLYRGSLRFSEMYITLEKIKNDVQCVKSETKTESSVERTTNEPSVNITKNEPSVSVKVTKNEPSGSVKITLNEKSVKISTNDKTVKVTKNVAIKSTGKGLKKITQTNSNTESATKKSTTTESTTTESATTKSATTKCTRNYINGVPIRMIYSVLPDPILKPKGYVAHSCSHHCVSWTAYRFNSSTQKFSMLTTPLYFGFIRDSIYFNSDQQNIFYKTPCGLTVRNMEEMFNYLNLTESELTIDQFDFNSCVKPFTELRSLNSFRSLVDMSQGKEQITISCVNSVNIKLPPQIEYITSRRATPGVNLNLNSNFLCGCDCTDNCQDKSKCACWRMTIEEQNIFNSPPNPNIGYEYRRLYEPVLTGIYECNNMCKCSRSCLNRVVQNPLSLKLQLFMTDKKGWGVRCLNDIPKGSFICIYVGNLYTKKDANKESKIDDDDYLAELDYIEVLEKAKEGYEEYAYAHNGSKMGESHLVKCKTEVSDFTIQLPKRVIKRKKNNSRSHGKSKVLPNRKSTREYFGKKESVYMIDAKTCGNIARFLNHSCDPNLFVQNVFVDTHDLRFPWVAYFALNYIKAGTELTWDYGYDVGSVPGKVIQCHCESHNCKGRLL